MRDKIEVAGGYFEGKKGVAEFRSLPTRTAIWKPPYTDPQGIGYCLHLILKIGPRINKNEGLLRGFAGGGRCISRAQVNH